MNKSTKNLSLLFFSILPLIITLIALNYLPNMIPAHYGFNGQVDRYGSKYESLIIPCISIFFFIFLFLITKYSIKKNSQNEKILFYTNLFTILLFNLLTYVFLYSSFKNITNLSNSFSTKFISIFMGIFLIVLGNFLPKCKKGTMIGIRTAATCSNDEVWFKTHRIGGKLFVIWGIIFTIISIFISSNLSTTLFSISLVMLVIFLSIYASNLAKKLK